VFGLRVIHADLLGPLEDDINRRAVVVLLLDVADQLLEVLDTVALGLRCPGFDDVRVELAGLGIDADVLQTRSDDLDDPFGVGLLDRIR